MACIKPGVVRHLGDSAIIGATNPRPSGGPTSVGRGAPHRQAAVLQGTQAVDKAERLIRTSASVDDVKRQIARAEAAVLAAERRGTAANMGPLKARLKNLRRDAQKESDWLARFETAHIFGAELKIDERGNLSYGGFHHYQGRPPAEIDIQVKRVGPAGSLVATVSVVLEDGSKIAHQGRHHTMFNPEWSQRQVLNEIESAYMNSSRTPRADGSVQWKGVSTSGLRVAGIVDQRGHFRTAYPSIP